MVMHSLHCWPLPSQAFPLFHERSHFEQVNSPNILFGGCDRKKNDIVAIYTLTKQVLNNYREQLTHIWPEFVRVDRENTLALGAKAGTAS